MHLRILVRGGGDLASGVTLRLWRAGWEVIITELARPRAVRRRVSFAQAVYDGQAQVEEACAFRVEQYEQAREVLEKRGIPVLVGDPQSFHPHVIVDARMRKRPPTDSNPADRNPAAGRGYQDFMAQGILVIGLGPGFTAGQDCHAVVETNRGPFLGRVFWQGSAEPDTGIPERVAGYQSERVLRAPAAGPVEALAEIGTPLRAGDPVARVAGFTITAPFDGVLRGLVQSGLEVTSGEKVGDIDPRGDPRLCFLVSDKALAVGGGVLEAILSFPTLRSLPPKDGCRFLPS